MPCCVPCWEAWGGGAEPPQPHTVLTRSCIAGAVASPASPRRTPDVPSPGEWLSPGSGAAPQRLFFCSLRPPLVRSFPGSPAPHHPHLYRPFLTGHEVNPGGLVPSIYPKAPLRAPSLTATPAQGQGPIPSVRPWDPWLCPCPCPGCLRLSAQVSRDRGVHGAMGQPPSWGRSGAARRALGMCLHAFACVCVLTTCGTEAKHRDHPPGHRCCTRGG